MRFIRTSYFILVSIAFIIGIIFRMGSPLQYNIMEFLQDIFTLISIFVGMMIKD